MSSKELLKGTLTVIILKLLSERDRMYGYEIFQQVKQQSNGAILLKDGSLYPALQKLAKEGLVSFEEESVNGRVRKYYAITKKGMKEKTAHMAAFKAFVESVNRIVFPELNTI